MKQMNHHPALRAGDIVKITDPMGLSECRVIIDSGAYYNLAYVVPTCGGTAVWIEKDKIVSVRSE